MPPDLVIIHSTASAFAIQIASPSFIHLEPASDLLQCLLLAEHSYGKIPRKTNWSTGHHPSAITILIQVCFVLCVNAGIDKSGCCWVADWRACVRQCVFARACACMRARPCVCARPLCRIRDVLCVQLGNLCSMDKPFCSVGGEAMFCNKYIPSRNRPNCLQWPVVKHLRDTSY